MIELEQACTTDDRLSAEQIDRRMAADGFPEMRLLWNRFQRLRLETREIGDTRLEALRRRHMGALTDSPVRTALLALPVAALLAWDFLLLADTLAPGAGAVTRFGLGALYVFNGLFLAGFLALLVQRTWVHPMMRILALDLARMLSHADYRRWFEQTPRARTARQRLAEMGVGEAWDDPAYVVRYRWSADGAERLPDRSVGSRVQEILKDYLGQKDAERQKYLPGKYFSSLQAGKPSVTRFVGRHGEEIQRNAAGALPPEEGLALLRSLLLEAVILDSPAAQRLDQQIRAIEEEHFLTGKMVQAEVWRRDPWFDLTSQEEFYSSASLRGVKWIGRGTKGRLGTFGYLRNPAISALDFRTRHDRQVRARLGAATAADREGRRRTVLFVDGVEGSRTIRPALVAQALADYARAAGFEFVMVNEHAHNTVPRRFVGYLRAAGAQRVSMTLQYVDSAEREYLDAFAAPVEPFEYARPYGRVSGYVIAVGEGNGDGVNKNRDRSGPPLAPFDAPGVGSRVIATLRLHALTALTSSACLTAAWVLAQCAPVLLLPFLLFAAAGVAGNAWYQRRSLRKRENAS